MPPDADAILGERKTMASALAWTSRRTQGADLAQVGLLAGGLIVGDLIALQMPGAPRHWSFKVRASGIEVLRWDFLPLGTPRRHRNPRPLPPGFPRTDTSLIHEHPMFGGLHGPYSRPLEGRETQDHRQAFLWFCDRANIDPGDQYREPPELQLALLP